jgi:hypothetical protein
MRTSWLVVAAGAVVLALAPSVSFAAPEDNRQGRKLRTFERAGGARSAPPDYRRPCPPPGRRPPRLVRLRSSARQ